MPIIKKHDIAIIIPEKYIYAYVSLLFPQKYSFIFNRAKRNDRKTSYKLNLDEKKKKKFLSVIFEFNLLPL